MMTNEERLESLLQHLDRLDRIRVEDIPQIECDWDKMMEIASDSAAKINEICQ